MSQLKKHIVAATLEKVNVFYIDQATKKWWNDRRNDEDEKTFTGWHWSYGLIETGPFKSRSAAIRDAYYMIILNRRPPNIAQYGLPLTEFNRHTVSPTAVKSKMTTSERAKTYKEWMKEKN